jgi:hypothetical protein
MRTGNSILFYKRRRLKGENIMNNNKIMRAIEMYEKAFKNKKDKYSLNADSDTLRFYVSLSGFLYYIFVKEEKTKIKSENEFARNIEIMKHVSEKIKKHPIIWKLFFMI